MTEKTKHGRSLYRLVRRVRDWLNRVTSDEGCTSADARHLRKINHDLADAEHQRSQELCVALADIETLKTRCKLLNQAYRDERARRHKLQQILADMPNVKADPRGGQSHE